MMSVITLFRREPPFTWVRLLLLALISGASNAAVLAFVNHAISHMDDQNVWATTLAALAATIVCFALSQRYLFISASGVAQRTIHNIRTRLAEKLQALELREIEGIDNSEIHACLTGELQTMSEAAISLTIFSQSVLALIAVFGYLAWLIPAGFAMAVGFVAIAATVNFRQMRKIDQTHQGVFAAEAQLLTCYMDLIAGFKELKLNAGKAQDLHAAIRWISCEAARKKLGLHTVLAGNLVTSETLFFIFVGVIVFGLSLISSIEQSKVALIAASALFLLGPISGVISGLPVLQRMNAAAKILLTVEARISTLDRANNEPTPRAEFTRITLNAVTFRYVADDLDFVVGPIDLDVARGQVLFITGGNGSGKSTLLKILTGLYTPSSGGLQIDGRPVARDDAGYRSLFSAVFSDNHLFKTLYGVHDMDPHEVDELLRLTEMDKKTRIIGGAFENIALSSGQRKRLALIAALLEHRPICVLDEWAADQDPYFRERFYRVILPYLKRLNKTVIAVTHDEKYFDVADFRIHLVEGRTQAVSSGASEAAKR